MRDNDIIKIGFVVVATVFLYNMFIPTNLVRYQNQTAVQSVQELQNNYENVSKLYLECSQDIKYEQYKELEEKRDFYQLFSIILLLISIVLLIIILFIWLQHKNKSKPKRK
jgi:isoleucyl-tRNA synthetase